LIKALFSIIDRLAIALVLCCVLGMLSALSIRINKIRIETQGDHRFVFLVLAAGVPPERSRLLAAFSSKRPASSM